MGLVYDRKDERVYNEKVYGEKQLKFLYQNFLGRCLMKIIILPFFSRIYGMYNRSKMSAKKVERFIQKNHINIMDYEKKDYHSFNDFITRKKLNVNWCKIDDALIAPADSKVLAYKVTNNLMIHIKNSSYTLNELLHNQGELLGKFVNGNCFVFRISMDDYHRYHYIDDGMVMKQFEVKGKLHTLSSFSDKEKVFSRNHRICNVLKTKNFGDVIWIEVGGLLSGKIHNHYLDRFKRGQEKGYFELGGSTIVLITDNRIKIDDDILLNSSNGVETKVEVGERVGMMEGKREV